MSLPGAMTTLDVVVVLEMTVVVLEMTVVLPEIVVEQRCGTQVTAVD
jgi:hypothetical protein